VETANLVVSIGTLGVLVACGLFLKTYLPSYMAEKGKNLASKEDVQEITRLVESVRAEYTSQLEQLKAELSSQEQVLERRRRVYEEICASLVIFVSCHDNSVEAKRRFYSAYASAWLWAPDAVLHKLNRFIDLQIRFAKDRNSVTQQELRSAYTDVVLAMRKDVGFQSTEVRASDYKFVTFGA